MTAPGFFLFQKEEKENILSSFFFGSDANFVKQLENRFKGKPKKLYL